MSSATTAVQRSEAEVARMAAMQKVVPDKTNVADEKLAKISGAQLRGLVLGVFTRKFDGKADKVETADYGKLQIKAAFDVPEAVSPTLAPYITIEGTGNERSAVIPIFASENTKNTAKQYDNFHKNLAQVAGVEPEAEDEGSGGGADDATRQQQHTSVLRETRRLRHLQQATIRSPNKPDVVKNLEAIRKLKPFSELTLKNTRFSAYLRPFDEKEAANIHGAAVYTEASEVVVVAVPIERIEYVMREAAARYGGGISQSMANRVRDCVLPVTWFDDFYAAYAYALAVKTPMYESLMVPVVFDARAPDAFASERLFSATLLDASPTDSPAVKFSKCEFVFTPKAMATGASGAQRFLRARFDVVQMFDKSAKQAEAATDGFDWANVMADHFLLDVFAYQETVDEWSPVRNVGAFAQLMPALLEGVRATMNVKIEWDRSAGSENNGQDKREAYVAKKGDARALLAECNYQYTARCQHMFVDMVEAVRRNCVPLTAGEAEALLASGVPTYAKQLRPGATYAGYAQPSTAEVHPSHDVLLTRSVVALNEMNDEVTPYSRYTGRKAVYETFKTADGAAHRAYSFFATVPPGTVLTAEQRAAFAALAERYANDPSDASVMAHAGGALYALGAKSPEDGVTDWAAIEAHESLKEAGVRAFDVKSLDGVYVFAVNNKWHEDHKDARVRDKTLLAEMQRVQYERVQAMRDDDLEALVAVGAKKRAAAADADANGDEPDAKQAKVQEAKAVGAGVDSDEELA